MSEVTQGRLAAIVAAGVIGYPSTKNDAAKSDKYRYQKSQISEGHEP